MSKTYVNINGQKYDAADVVLPDRKFRDAWTAPVDGVVRVDMAKAKEITRERIRADRYAEYERRGGPFGPAITVAEQNADKDPRIDAASTPEQLKALDFKRIVGK